MLCTVAGRGALVCASVGCALLAGCDFGRAWKKLSEVTNRFEFRSGCCGRAAGAEVAPVVAPAAGLAAGRAGGAGRTWGAWVAARTGAIATSINPAALPKFSIQTFLVLRAHDVGRSFGPRRFETKLIKRARSSRSGSLESYLRPRQRLFLAAPILRFPGSLLH